MSIALDPARSGDSGTRAAARRAEAAALSAADAACDAYRATLDEAQQASVRPDRVIAVVDGVPGDALGTAVADLGSAAYAASRAIHLAIETGSDEDVRRAADVALAAAAAAEQGADTLAVRGRADAAVALERLAHAAAMLAHLSADALEAHGVIALPHSLVDPLDHPAVPFPPSWRRRIEQLSGDCAAAKSLSAVPAAAVAACTAAQRALHVYGRSGHGTVASRTMSRVTRIAALAACYAGVAALDLHDASPGFQE